MHEALSLQTEIEKLIEEDGSDSSATLGEDLHSDYYFISKA